MKKLLSCSLALAALVVAGCGGGAGSTSPALPAPGSPGGNGPITQAKSSITFTIAISGPQTTSNGKKPSYVSPGTQSLGIVETDQGASASNPAVYVNVSNCPTVSGVVTCSATVPAAPGLDTFVVSTYGAQNGGGSVLGSGSLQFQIQPGVNNTTTPLTVNGTVASIVVTPLVGDLPLGQSEPVNIIAKDASGAVIAGAFSNAPITLSGTNLTISKTTFNSSSDLTAGVTIAWNNGYQSSWGTSTLTATTKDSVTGTAKVNPATGMAFYNVGNGGAGDALGFKMMTGPDGKLYFDTLNAVSCTITQFSGLCAPTASAVHQYDPATGNQSEVTAGAESIGMTFDTNGTLWIAGGYSQSVSYMPNGATNFTQANVHTIALPSPTPYPNGGGPFPFTRTIVQDGSGNIWAGDTYHHLFKIPIANPTASAVAVYTPTPHASPGNFQTYGLGYANGNLYIMDRNASNFDQFSTTTFTFGTQTALPVQSTVAGDTSHPYDFLQSGSMLYAAQMDSYSAVFPQGGIGVLNTTTGATSQFTLPPAFDVQPGAMSVGNGELYYQDFGTQALGVVDLASGTSRAWPVAANGAFSPYFPNGVGAVSDGTAWFTCYGGGVAPVPSPCIGHTVYISSWSLWPGYSLSINGTGVQAEQLIGIMEAPSANSGPFTAASNNTNVCTTGTVSDHNFNIIGVAAGACAITVTDKNGLARTIQVTVTTTSGTIQGRRREATGGVL